MIDTGIIVSAIERKGWQAIPVHEGWQCRQPGSPRSFDLSISPSWVSFRQRVPLGLALSAGHPDDLRALLVRNEAMFLARYGLDPAGHPVLLVDLPRVSGLLLLDMALVALARYADPASDTAASDDGDERMDAPGLAHQTVAYYVRAVEGYGWGLRGKPDGMSWPLAYKGQRLFDVFFTASRSWAYFQAPMLTGAPAALIAGDDAAQDAFLRYILRVNEAWYMVKLGLTASNQPVVMLEVPVHALDFDLFRWCTRLIASVLDCSARELQLMAELDRDHRLKAWLLEG